MPNSFEANTSSGSLDGIDLHLLAILQANASISNIALADKLHISAPTCLRRTKRLQQEGWIEKQVAILSSDKMGRFMGHSVTAVIEVSLDKQGEELLQAFETRRKWVEAETSGDLTIGVKMSSHGAIKERGVPVKFTVLKEVAGAPKW